MRKQRSGFTIIELLIIIVIIAVLAAATVISYNGIQRRTRDSQRKHDIASIQKALELYYIDNGKYPPGSGSTTINANWSTTADSSWSNLETTLKPYIDRLPSDPVATPNGYVLAAGAIYNYAYFADTNGTYCSTGKAQMYLLIYKFEGQAQVNQLDACTVGAVPGPYGGPSNVRKVK